MKLTRAKQLSQYFTPRETVDDVCSVFEDFLSKHERQHGVHGVKLKDCFIIEPSAGDGRFVDTLTKHFGCRRQNILAVEVDPRWKSVVDWIVPLDKGGFLALDRRALRAFTNCGVASAAASGARGSVTNKLPIVIGNPPYSAPQEYGNDRGHFSNMIVKFLNHIASEGLAKYVGFIVPASMRRPLTQSKIDPRLAVVLDIDLDCSRPYEIPSDDGRTIAFETMKNCIFQIYEFSNNEVDKKTVAENRLADQKGDCITEWAWSGASGASESKASKTSRATRETKSRDMTGANSKGQWQYLDPKTKKWLQGPFQFVGNLEKCANAHLTKWATLNALGDVYGKADTQARVAENIDKFRAQTAQGRANPQKSGGSRYYLYIEPECYKQAFAALAQTKPLIQALGKDRSHNWSSIDVCRNDFINLFLNVWLRSSNVACVTDVPKKKLFRCY